jgi:hypothetical protein
MDLSGADVALFDAAGATFQRCDFRRAVLRHGTLGGAPGTVYRDCRFERADLRGVHPGGARFEGCEFADVRLEKWLCFTAEFVGCRFAGRLAEVVFRGRVFPPGSALAGGRERNEFAGNDFTAAELVGVAFVGGIDIGAQRLPDGPQYVRVPSAPDRIARARGEIRGWPAEEARAATVLLDFYSRRGYEEQAELFVRRDSLTRIVPAAVRKRIWAVLLADRPAAD